MPEENQSDGKRRGRFTKSALQGRALQPKSGHDRDKLNQLVVELGGEDYLEGSKAGDAKPPF